MRTNVLSTIYNEIVAKIEQRNVVKLWWTTAQIGNYITDILKSPITNLRSSSPTFDLKRAPANHHGDHVVSRQYNSTRLKGEG